MSDGARPPAPASSPTPAPIPIPGTAPPAGAGGGALVIDTNIALDLLLFDDPACAGLRAALHGGGWRWLASAAMRAELARVLTYPPLVRALARRQRSADAVLAAFDALAHPVPAAVPAPMRCADPDDQGFVDLAHAHGAPLLSKDLRVLAMRKQLQAGVYTPQGAMKSGLF